jgi:multicomponent Na+:H+ antiporter subunit E
VLLAAGSSALLWPAGRRRLRYPALLRFVPYFLGASVYAGWDVARRALHPKLPLEPGFIEYRFRMAGRPPRIFFALLVSLLPGTAGARLDGESLLVHVLDERMPNAERLAELESQVAGLLGMHLEDGAP